MPSEPFLKRTRNTSSVARRSVPGKAARWSIILVIILLIVAAIVGHWMFTPPAPYVPVNGLDPSTLSMIALGDQGSGDLQQWWVGQAMERVAVRDGRLDMVVLLGDNFYGKTLTTTHDLAWQMKFERVYWGQWLSHVPFFAVLGNHDYPVSQKVEIEYSLQHAGSGRWQMPGNFYVKDFGSVDGRPLVRMVFLDTSAPRDTFQHQIDLLDQAFQQPGPAPVWRIAAAHHPVRNHGEHGEDSALIALLLPALTRNKVDVFLAGHDHNQQLLLREAEPAWVISGAGGQKLYPVATGQQDTSFATETAGFTKLDLDARQLRLRYYDDRGNPQAGYHWARDCQWMAKGCLLPDVAEPVLAQ